jgi:hypothetical protein
MPDRLRGIWDFLRDYAKGIPLDWLIWTKSGHAFLVALIGVAVSAITWFHSPSWSHDALIAGVALGFVAAAVAMSHVISVYGAIRTCRAIFVIAVLFGAGWFVRNATEIAPPPPPTLPVSANDIVVTQDSAKALVCPPIHQSVPTAYPSAASGPHQISLEDGLKFISDFRLIQGEAQLKITAPPENMAVRYKLVQLLTFPNSLLPLAANDIQRPDH